MGGPPEPPGEEPPGRTEVGVGPELPEALLQAPGPGHLGVAPLERPERGALLRGHVLRAHEPEVLCASQPVIVGLLQGPMLLAPDLVHGIMEVVRDVELVEDDLGPGIVQVSLSGLDVGLRQVHGNGLDPLALGRGGRRPEAVQAPLPPVVSQIRARLRWRSAITVR